MSMPTTSPMAPPSIFPQMPPQAPPAALPPQAPPAAAAPAPLFGTGCGTTDTVSFSGRAPKFGHDGDGQTHFQGKKAPVKSNPFRK